MSTMIGRTFICLLSLTWIVSKHYTVSGKGCSSEDEFNHIICKRCVCSTTANKKTVVDCSNRNLWDIPEKLPPDLVSLNLQMNNISKITNGSLYGCEHLQTLDLSANNLIRIDRNAFDATRIRELYLNDNQLILNSTDAVYTFSALNQSLKILSIQDNVICVDEIFTSTNYLEELSVDGSLATGFGREFSMLPDLNKLSVYYKSSNLTNQTFANFSGSAVRELKVVSNLLANVQPLSFAHFKHLQVLDLSYNQLLTLNGASRAWYGLNYTNITTLILTKVKKLDQQDVNIDPDFFNYLESTKIKFLRLDRNNIGQMAYGFSYLPNLEHLDLSFNRVSNLQNFLIDLFFCFKLRFLDVSNQIRRYINRRSSLYIPNEHDIKKPLPEEPPAQRGPRHKRYDKNKCHAAIFKTCNISMLFRKPSNLRNNLKNIPLPVNNICAPAPRNLEILNVSQSWTIVQDEMPAFLILGTTKIKYFEMKANGMSIITGPLMINRPRATEQATIDLSNNEIHCIAKDVLSYSVKRGFDVGRIILAGNNLWEQLAQDFEGDTFGDYKNLTELNLANNRIKTLPSGVFDKIPHLKILNLSGNSLQLIEFNYNHFDRLQILDLSNNLLTNLDHDALTGFDKIIRKSNVSINFVGNPLQCSCINLQFLHWLESNRDRIVDYQNTSCFFNSVIYDFSKIDDILTKLNFDCSKTLALVMSGVLLGLTLLGIFLSVFLYRHRWEVRYCLLKLSHRGYKYQQLIDQSNQYLYDAFVAFEKNDIEWVENELMRNLETPGGPVQDMEDAPLNDVKPMRLCIHDRDFEPGNLIQENIVKAIEQSRKIILVISNNFLESNWCRFELEIATRQSLERGRNLVVPILLEDVSMERMPVSLRWIVGKHTYIEWNENNGDHEEFWIRLRRVLANVENNSFSCECGRTVLTSQ